jgi:type IV pilus assembly protein PilM
MGDAVSNLSILINNLPRFTRDVFIGGREFTKQIANTFSVDLKEAERIKTNPEGKKQEILHACESTIMNIVQELRLSFDYFSSERSVEISHLLITGGSSLLEGLDEVFQKNLEIPVTRWNPLSHLEISESFLKDSRFKAEPYKMGVALGLALYAYD